MELTEMVDKLHKTYVVSDTEWEDYGLPTKDDLAVSLAAMSDYLDGLEPPAEVHLPAANLLMRSTPSGEFEVFLKVGDVDIDPAGE